MRAASVGTLALWIVATAAGAAAPPKAVVRGAVTDAETGAPIARFRLVPTFHYRDGRPGTWQLHRLKAYSGGLYEAEAPWEKTRFRVDAEGYLPAVSRVVKGDEREAVIHFALRRDPGLWGTVRAADGAAVPGARVVHATASRVARVENGRLSISADSEQLGAVVVTTAADGGFRLPAEVDPGRVVATHETYGYAEVEPEALAAASVITLRPWGRVEGRVLAGAVPVAGRLVTLGGIRPFSEHDFCISMGDEMTTAAAGRFAFGQAVPGRLQLTRATPRPDGGWHAVSGTVAFVDVRERQTTVATLGGAGRPVIGRLRARTDRKPPFDWSQATFRLFPPAPHIGWPGDDDDWKEYGRFAGSEEGRPYFRDNQPVRADGTFRVEGLPQGRYSLHVMAREPAANDLQIIGWRNFEVPLTATGQSDEPLDLGDVEARVLPRTPPAQSSPAPP